MYKFEAEALVRFKAGGNKIRKFRFTYGKAQKDWNTADFNRIEAWLSNKEDVQGDVSIMDLKELEDERVTEANV